MDWVSLIRELRDSGMSLSRIAEACGSRVQTISDIAAGYTKMPNWKLGDALIALHRVQVKRAQRKAAKAEA